MNVIEDDPAEATAVDGFAAVERDQALLRQHGRILLHIAEASIHHGLEFGKPLGLDPQRFAAELRATRATFVTLKRGGALRGCIGSLSAWRALVADVSHNAYGAAFGDKRFPPLTAEERHGLDLSVSLLSPAEPMQIRDEADLLAQLRPGRDGLIIKDEEHRAIFLPQVWATLPEPRDFLGRLKRKAGLAADHWSPTFTAARFAATSVRHGDVAEVP
jgi:AmmeMemoRadiSam system protein A